jgi:hypothetical protein
MKLSYAVEKYIEWKRWLTCEGIREINAKQTEESRKRLYQNARILP